MSFVSGNFSRNPGRRSLPATALAGATALLLAACQGDAPTAGNNDLGLLPAPRVFTMAAGASSAVKLSTHRILKPLPTIQLRSTEGPGLPGGAPMLDPVINSPWDLTSLGGPVVHSATAWNIYVNCPGTPASCWGTGEVGPGTFLNDFNRSNLLRVVEQYIGNRATGRFPVAEASIGGVPFVNNSATIDDILNIVFSASSFFNASGYTNIIHVFLPQGTDMCIDVGFCYSPDDFSTFAFCAFHGSVDFGPNQHVLFSVEPYQFVPGCSIPSQAPHGVIDPTASTLSHEQIETITDPDGDAWFNLLTGNEISDLCFAFANNERINGRNYVIQPEYSNRVHACIGGLN